MRRKEKRRCAGVGEGSGEGEGPGDLPARWVAAGIGSGGQVLSYSG